MVVGGNGEDIEFECNQCWNSYTGSLDVIERRYEITEFHHDSGVYEVVVCGRCHGLMSPAIREVEK